MDSGQIPAETLPYAPPAWVAGYIGIPFVELGRDREGCDCWGLQRLVFNGRLGIELPSRDTEYRGARRRDIAANAALIKAHIDEDWQKVAEKPDDGNCPLDGIRLYDLLLIKKYGEPAHVGMVVARGQMLHIEQGVDSCVVEFDKPDQLPGILEVRRHRRLCGHIGGFVAGATTLQPIMLKPIEEIIPPGAGDVLVTARQRPFSTDIQQMAMLAGATVAEIVEKAIPGPTLRRYASVTIGDEEIPRELWHRVRPKPGTAVTVLAMPGQNPGGQQKSPLRMFLQIVVVVLAAVASWWAGGALGPVAGALIGAAVAAAGNFAVNALVPLPKADMGQLSGEEDSSPTLSIQGTRNQARPYGKIPRAYGRHKRTADYGAIPYTEIRGSDQYLRLLFDLGYGPQKVEAIQIGATPIANFEGIELKIREGWDDDPPLSLVGTDVHDDVFQILLDQVSSWTQRTSAKNCDALMIEIDGLQGMTAFDELGERSAVTVELDAEYRVKDAVAWTPLAQPIAFLARQTGTLVRPEVQERQKLVRTYFLSLNHITGLLEGVGGTSSNNPSVIPAGNLPICMMEMPFDGTKPARLTDLRSAEMISAGYFVPTADLPLANVSNSITLGPGTVVPPTFVITHNSTNVVRETRSWPVPRDQYDVRVRRTTLDTADDKIVDKVWWTILRITTNTPPIAVPGHTTIELVIKGTNELQGIVNELNCITTSILWDFDGTSWAWRPTRWAHSAYVDVLIGQAGRTPLPSSRVDWTGIEAWALDNIANGRKFDAVFDFANTRLEALKTIASAGRASFGMNGHLYAVVQDKPQSVPVQHFTPRNSWGFTMHRRFPDAIHGVKIRFVNERKDFEQDQIIVYADGFDESNATKFSEVDMFGIVDPDQVWKAGRYQRAVMELRPYDYTLSADVEHLIAKRGKLVKVSHDVILVGLAYGRIKTLAKDGSGNVTGLTVDEALPMEVGKTYGLVIRTTRDVALSATPVTVAGDQVSVTLVTPIPFWTAPSEGDLFSFGEAGRESIDCIVSNVSPQADMAAKLVLVDAAPAVHLADTGTIPDFDPIVTASGSKPPKPQVFRVTSDESVLVRQGDGSLQSRILIELQLTGGTIEPAASLQVIFARSDAQEPFSTMAPLPGSTTVVSVVPVQDQVAYDVILWTVSAKGVPSDRTTIAGHVVVGKSTPPPDVPGVMREMNDARWSYPIVPPDMAGYVIRANPGNNRDWEPAQELHPGVWSLTRFPLGALTTGSWTILVKAIDVAGNVSVNAAALVIGLGDVKTDNLVRTIDFGALGWPGVITNGFTIGGFLQASDGGDLFWPASDAAPFWQPDDAADFWVANWLPLTYVATVIPDSQEVPAALRLISDVQGSNWTIEYRPSGSQEPFWHDDSTLFWSADGDSFWPDGPSYLPWPGELPISAQNYEIRVSIAGGSKQGQLSALRALIDMPDIEEDFDDIAIAPGGTRLPLTKAYRKILQVPVTLQDDGGTGFTAKVIDKDPVNGPLVKVFDIAGIGVAGLIDVNGLRGY
ncbi:host specificity factor TipJ family phage tail protein [Hypericibacter sp.]|uniref:host specificity factor TipJ family phage tail protein n=1 Tax=Hypericibacter sp. TaxID=2705401 RepID=UPI003D6C7DA5